MVELDTRSESIAPMMFKVLSAPKLWQSQD